MMISFYFHNQAARLLGPPTKFEASKLKVVFTGEEMEKHTPSTIHRAYTLTHCDFTANLTLSVSNNIHARMVSRSLATCIVYALIKFINISHESDNTLPSTRYKS